MRVRAAIAAVLSLAPFAGPATAASGWVAARDARLRADLQLLVDERVLRLPLTVWPLPLPDLEQALRTAERNPVPLSPATAAALARLQSALRTGSGHPGLAEVEAFAGQPGLLREFGALGREDAEIKATSRFGSDAWSAAAVVSVVAGARDGQSVRLDGSHVTAQVGNWLLGAGALDRFWGPAQDGSLILSGAARPIPALMFERATSRPFDTRWLSWLGPWRVSGLLGRMDGGRDDVNHPLFFGLRVTVQPRDWLEIGLSRTAQLCGDGRSCSLQTFFDMLLGRDLIGEGGNVSDEEQPGNQLAGFDIRIRSPWRALPLAVYAQDIGEDVIDYRPTDRLAQYGIETWRSFAQGGSLRAQFEYAYTACAVRNDPPLFDCAYTNNLYNADGYRFRGVPVGHMTDADSESLSGSVRYVAADGREWLLRIRHADINKGAADDPYHALSTGPSQLRSAEVGLRVPWIGGELELQFGVERFQPTLGSFNDRLIGGLRWQRQFD